MGIGTKRICQSCGSKFYDLEKDPIKCPKCATVFNPEVALKPKRGRKKVGAKDKEEEIEISLDDEAVEELDDDAAVEELDDENAAMKWALMMTTATTTKKAIKFWLILKRTTVIS